MSEPMSNARSKTASLAGILADARSMVPMLREQRQELNDLRRVPDETVKALRDIGVFDMGIPRELGGPDLGADGILELSIELGRGCGATSWCAGNWAVHNLFVSVFSDLAKQELFSSDVAPIISTGFSPARATTREVDGGTILNGTWDFASGVNHADWIVVVAVGERGPVGHLVPTSQITILDSWHTIGLRGTGSHDVQAHEIFVPEHRLVDMGVAMAGQSATRHLYESPFLGLPLPAYFGSGVMGSILGIAVGAVEVFTERTSEKIGGISGLKASSRPEVHLRLGEAAADVDAALRATRAVYAEMRAAGQSKQQIAPLDVARWQRDMGWSAKLATAAVLRLYDAGGAHVLFDGDQLQQFYRDINAASHHYHVSWDHLFSTYGRLSLGYEK
jgi:3-hydroxy-9,10-secoandrosta-1,3,5(10)-triene-9,17-dione monooxygenase